MYIQNALWSMFQLLNLPSEHTMKAMLVC